MRYADLDQRLQLERPAFTFNDEGGRDIRWEPCEAVWAEVEPISGSEAPVAQALRSKLTHRVKLRYREGLKPSMRFSSGARVFDIVAVFPPTSRRRWSICYCSEVGAP